MEEGTGLREGFGVTGCIEMHQVRWGMSGEKKNRPGEGFQKEERGWGLTKPHRAGKEQADISRKSRAQP